MRKQLNILLLEDVPSDAELTVHELREAQIPFVSKRVDTLEDFSKQVTEFKPDIILADYNLPQFTALDALRLLKDSNSDVPLILLTGSLSEEVAVECMKQGADDYILKSATRRLPSALLNSLTKKDAEREKEKAEVALRHSEEYFRSLIENALDIIIAFSEDTAVRYISPSIQPVLGYRPEELLGKNIFELIHQDDAQNVRTVFTEVIEDRLVSASLEWRFQHKDGSWRFMEGTGKNLIEHPAVAAVVVNCRDITVRKQTEDALRGLKKAVETLQLGVTITDIHRKIVYVNPAEARMHGYAVEDLIGKDVRMFAPVDRWAPARLEQLRSLRRESKNIRRDGVIFPVQLTSDIVTDSLGAPIGIVTACEDITDRKRMEEALKESEERYALAARGTNEGLYDWNLKADEVYFSDRWKAMLGCAGNEIGNSPEEWFKRIHPEDLLHVRGEIEAHRKGSTPYFESEHRMLHQDGTYRWMLTRGIAVHDEEGVSYRMAGSQTDITGRKIAEEQLIHDALHDALTGLPNRILFMDRLKNALERSKRREEYSFAVLFLDLDRFKVVNDSLGHMIGDQLLVSVARRLLGCIRPGDSVARLGGDEFGLLLDDIKDVVGSVRVCNRVQNELKLAFNLEGQEVFTTASIGIALSRRGYHQAEEILRDADTAMYRAKSLGRARHELFDTGMRAHAVNLMQLETDLRRAVDREEFQVYYQPILHLETGRIHGFEALARWQHPQRGLLYPADFIPVAEETGLIVPIGHWMAREACRQARRWHDAWGPNLDFSISVNLSVRQFSHRNLVEQIKEILQETGIEPNRLILEVTESVLMENSELATSILSQLKDLNIQLHLDDFGTGYSSLSYLHRFPIDKLKIDKSFIARIGLDQESGEIVRVIVMLAQTLGMGVVAEGIETREQLAQLVSMGCRDGQGFLFSKPLESKAMSDLVDSVPDYRFPLSE